MFSIIIPTWNNLDYLKLCVESIKKNSKYEHEIIVHINEDLDNTSHYLKENNILFTLSDINIGLCKGVNIAVETYATKDYIVYAHDDMYFAPDWDYYLINEINNLHHNNFYLSGTHISTSNSNDIFNCGVNSADFNEEKFLKNYQQYVSYDYQGPVIGIFVVHKEIWKKVNGFSEEFFPGCSSDDDLCMKIWNQGVRIFKGIHHSKCYHFGSIGNNKYKVMKNENNMLFKNHKYTIGHYASNLFLLKWGITKHFFRKFFIRSDEVFDGPLQDPPKTFKFIYYFLLCKIYYFLILLKSILK